MPFRQTKSPPQSSVKEVSHADSRLTRWKRRGLLGRTERGATAVEYALMVGLIAVAIIVPVSILSGRVKSTFNTTGNAIVASDAGGAAPSRQAWCTSTYPGSSYYATGAVMPPPWNIAPFDACHNSGLLWGYAGP